MDIDLSERARRELTALIHSMGIVTREDAAALGELLGEEKMAIDTDELRKSFKVLGFMAPYVQCRHQETGEKHLFLFSHFPRWYFGQRKEL